MPETTHARSSSQYTSREDVRNVSSTPSSCSPAAVAAAGGGSFAPETLPPPYLIINPRSRAPACPPQFRKKDAVSPVIAGDTPASHTCASRRARAPSVLRDSRRVANTSAAAVRTSSPAASEPRKARNTGCRAYAPISCSAREGLCRARSRRSSSPPAAVASEPRASAAACASSTPPAAAAARRCAAVHIVSRHATLPASPPTRRAHCATKAPAGPSPPLAAACRTRYARRGNRGATTSFGGAAVSAPAAGSSRARSAERPCASAGSPSRTSAKHSSLGVSIVSPGVAQLIDGRGDGTNEVQIL
eukprot:Rhum_TRINITY_DN15248_c4_g1::Rhum_TRINITY_DN15248_c4_g1_i1::g.143845::m.143845